MLLFEHDAKELLAVQGIPVPGGIRLEQPPQGGGAAADEKSGPWIVKPQILGGGSAIAGHAVPANTNAEIHTATKALLGTTIAGRTIRSVLIERRFSPHSETFLRLECDAPSAGIRITLGTPVPTGHGGRHADQICPQTVVAPDPNSVIAGVAELAAAVPDAVRAPVTQAGRMLAPLFFGYEAVELEIAPMMLLRDGSWAVGDVRLSIDESALFRHPELLTLVERRDYAYREVRLRRRYGVDYRVIDPKGAVATIAGGPGYGAFLIDEIRAKGLSPYNYLDTAPLALGTDAETLDYLLEAFGAATSLRCLVIAIVGDMVELPAFARRFAGTLANRPDFRIPIVARLIGAAAGAAGAILEQAAPTVQVEPGLEAALAMAAKHAGSPPE